MTDVINLLFVLSGWQNIAIFLTSFQRKKIKLKLARNRGNFLFLYFSRLISSSVQNVYAVSLIVHRRLSRLCREKLRSIELLIPIRGKSGRNKFTRYLDVTSAPGHLRKTSWNRCDVFERAECVPWIRRKQLLSGAGDKELDLSRATFVHETSFQGGHEQFTLALSFLDWTKSAICIA